MPKVSVDINAKDNASKKVKNVERNVNSAASSMAKKLAGLAAAYIGVNTAVKYFNDYILTYGDRLNKLSDQLDINVASLDKFKQIAELGGKDIEGMVVSLNFMNKSIGETSMGLGESMKAFEELNISVDDLKKLSPEEQLFTIAEALDKIPDKTTQIVLGNKILGEQYTSMIPVLDNVREKFEKTSTSWSNEAAKNVADFNDNLTILSDSLKQSILPEITNFIELINKLGETRLVKIWINLREKKKAEENKMASDAEEFMQEIYGVNKIYVGKINDIRSELKPIEIDVKYTKEEFEAGQKEILEAQTEVINNYLKLRGLESEYLRLQKSNREAELLDAKTNLERQLIEFQDNKALTLQAQENFKAKVAEINERYDNEENERRRDTEQRYWEDHIKILEDAAAYEKDVEQKKADEIKKINEQKAADAKRIDDMITNNLSNGFMELIKGTKSFEESFKSMAQSIINDILRMIIQQQIYNAVSSIGGGAGAAIGPVISGNRATGGPVLANKNYIVGEKGPEILSMGQQSGTIIPNTTNNNSVSTPVIINVTSSGRSEEDARRTGKLFESEIKRILINEKRTGGVLA